MYDPNTISAVAVGIVAIVFAVGKLLQWTWRPCRRHRAAWGRRRRAIQQRPRRPPWNHPLRPTRFNKDRPGWLL